MSRGAAAMLKSTHRPAPPRAASTLPAGWTEHRAPSGQIYYHNANTKQSTYVRPVDGAQSDVLVIDFAATLPDPEIQASLKAMRKFDDRHSPLANGRSLQNGDGYKPRSRPNRQGDRPKSKAEIPNCAPWLLVKTKYGRRFVHNTETKQSFWKFPSEVMMAVIDMDRIEWEKKNKEADEKEKSISAQQSNSTPQPEPQQQPRRPSPMQDGFDSDEYEEVEVTDDEDEDHPPALKRSRTEEIPHSTVDGQQGRPQEFNEDDIEWQLAQMEADEIDPGYDYDHEDQDLEDEEAMTLTEEDRQALFRTLLDQLHISPFSTFDALIDTNTRTATTVTDDDRWTALPNMSARRVAFDAWSRDRITQRNATESVEDNSVPDGSSNLPTSKFKKVDPRIAYLRFLSKEATTKLYWPEFKRKFRKAPEMTDRYFLDKDREKLYREYITKLKLSEADRKIEFTTLLKSVPVKDWQTNSIPEKIEKDLKFYGIREEGRRQELVEGYISTAR
ncbi:hypothetical protein LTR05_006394 [Lithohypha guttulata]|uniref:WW domain-containing protein n=1 Tax=Lithohypha guttulata TaxID=1690604 RepID=A0AAN7SXA3_9EURO|nr:hypothetical protein LTR05_006394 [Lithohypha guttulata]